MLLDDDRIKTRVRRFRRDGKVNDAGSFVEVAHILKYCTFQSRPTIGCCHDGSETSGRTKDCYFCLVSDCLVSYTTQVILLSTQIGGLGLGIGAVQFDGCPAQWSRSTRCDRKTGTPRCAKMPL